MLMLAAPACVVPPQPSELSCGAGTRQVGGKCVAAEIEPEPGLTCGDGTEEVDGKCVPVETLPDPEVTCGEGTEEWSGRRVVAAGTPVLHCVLRLRRSCSRGMELTGGVATSA